jgi:hypothetical protein
MAALPFFLLMCWFGWWLEKRERERKRVLREIRDWARAETKTKRKPKEADTEDDELFMTDLGDSDDMFGS